MANNRIRGLTVEIGGDTTKLGQALKDVESKSRSLSGELTQINRLLKMDPSNVELLTQKHQVLTQAVATTKAKLDKLREAEANVQAQFAAGKVSQEQVRALQREIIATESKLSAYKSEAKKAKDAIKALGAESQDAVDDVGDLGDAAEASSEGIGKADIAFGAFIGTLSSKVVSGVADKLKDLAKQAIQVGMDFTSSMAEVAAISGAVGPDLDALAASAREFGANTIFSAAESAQALKYMAMAGWKTNDMLAGMEGIVNLAAASGEELGTVSDIVTDALTAFGLQASDSAHFADVLAAASNNANTNVSMLGGSFKYVAPVAGALGYSIEDVAVNLGLMANSGIKAEQAGTSMRAMITRLTKPTKDVARAFAALGIDDVSEAIKNADGTMKPLSETIGILREKMAGLTEAEKANVAAGIAGQEAMSGLLAIVNASDEDFVKLTKSIASADGTAKNMADTMNDNLAGDLKNLNSAAEELGIKFFEAVEEPMRDVVKYCTKSLIPALTKFGKWVGKNGPLVKSTLAAATAGTVAYKVQLKLAALAAKEHAAAAVAEKTAVEGVTVAQKVLNLVQKASPTALIITAAAAAAAALIAYAESTKTAAAGASNLSDKERELVEASYDAATAFKEQQETTQQSADSIASQFEHTERLSEELMSLADASGQVEEADRARAEVLLGLLNDALGTEYSMVNGQIQAYDDLQDSVKQLIEVKRQEALLAAYKEDYTVALKNRKDAVNAAALAYKDYALQQDVVTQKLKEYAEADEHYTKTGGSAAEARMLRIGNELEAERKALAEKKASWEELCGAVDTYSGTIRQYEDALVAAQSNDSAEVQRILDQEATAYADHGDTVSQIMEHTLTVLRQNAVDAGKAAEETRRNWENGVEGFTEAMVKEAEEGYQNAIKAYATVYSDAKGVGLDLGDGMIAGIKAKSGAVIGAVAGLVNSVFDRTRKVSDSHSPSRRMKGIFSDIWAGGIVGTEKSRDPLLSSAEDTINKMMGLFESDRVPTTEIQSLSKRTVAEAAADRGQSVGAIHEYGQKLDAILAAIKDGQVVMLDGDALVGGTIHKFNSGLNDVMAASDRNVR